MGAIFSELEAIVRACELQSGSADRAFIDYALERLQTSIRSVSSLLDAIAPKLLFMKKILSNLILCPRELSQEWQLHLERCIQRSSEASYTSPSVLSSGRGRPKFDIPKNS